MVEFGDSNFQFVPQNVLKRFKKLCQLDARLSTFMYVVLENIKYQRFLPNLVEEGKVLSDYLNVCLVGSAAEGTMIARSIGHLFLEMQEKTPAGEGNADELDNMNYSVAGSTAEEREIALAFGHLVLEMQGKTLRGCDSEVNRVALCIGRSGLEPEMDVIVDMAKVDENKFCHFVEPTTDNFYKVRNHPDIWKLIQEETKLNDRFLNIMNKNKRQAYLSGKNVKDLIQEVVNFDFTSHALLDSVATILSTSLCGYNAVLQPHMEIHGPAVNILLNVVDQEQNFNFCILDIDAVAVIQCNFWPPMAKEWITRERKWPPQDLVADAVKQGCQLVAKPKGFSRAATDQGSSDHIDKAQWRMSFTLAEKVINKARSPTQKLVYLMAKIIFYTHLKLTEDGHEFSSYILKTCMMWLQEETSGDVWTENNIVAMVSQMFVKMKDAVVTGKLSYYFIPEINLLSEYPADLLDQAGKKLSCIAQNVVHFMGFSLIIDGLCLVGDTLLKIGKKELANHFKVHSVHPPNELYMIDGETSEDEVYDEYELD